MRGENHEGRFDINHEAEQMYEGMREDLQELVGFDVDWFKWRNYYLEDNAETIMDDIYDVSSSNPTEGRRWMAPFKMPCVALHLQRGGNVMNERGFYSTDTLSLTLSSGEVRNKIPEILRNEPNQYMKDRILYRGQVFTPVRINPAGAFGHRWAVVIVDCLEVNSEELVNDEQFLGFAEEVGFDLRGGTNG